MRGWFAQDIPYLVSPATSVDPVDWTTRRYCLLNPLDHSVLINALKVRIEKIIALISAQNQPA